MALGYSKQLIPLCGIPTIVRTMAAFDKAELIRNVIIICRNEEINNINEYIRHYKIKKVYNVVPGGDTRQQSVLAGINSAPQETEFFAIHDGARALITPDEINHSIEDGFRYGASALAVPVKSTIKVIDENGFVVSTPERSQLWEVQTPQVFEKSMFVAAMSKAIEDGADYTDDCQLAEHMGVSVHLCRGQYTNIKLTTADDIAAAETIIKSRDDLM
jgi:2-C-methyl-D-erythritol 4-phosphate cytidylyltransferase